jgi:hypothetical protein
VTETATDEGPRLAANVAPEDADEVRVIAEVVEALPLSRA